eukprot:TRINITY_DN214_c0_g1_i1.p2 TRINITY_DN214_c0_g1~~TRINITY_DN214_c0_g1_i1.p2  ORF type:complete len:889 (+),score=112.15 TRINITY_DN214_c0_g1_i1:7443-10109(+)
MQKYFVGICQQLFVDIYYSSTFSNILSCIMAAIQLMRQRKSNQLIHINDDPKAKCQQLQSSSLQYSFLHWFLFSYLCITFLIIGEDKDHPVTELLHSGPGSKGWESPRFGSFPQTIILQFKSLVVLRQIQFLSHQAKIATKIELFVYAPSTALQLPTPQDLPNLKFKRIGYLSLDSNERSGFTARELKSVYIEVPAYFLKVALHKCHVNKHNIFNQVGLIAINCLGEALDSGERAPEAPPVGHMLEEAGSYDPVTLEKLKMLNAAKEKAVAEENFDEAKRIKDIMDKLKGIGKQLAALELKKKMAIENEDYESAKVLKVEIERLRGSAFEERQRGSTPNSRFGGGEYMPISHEYVLEDQKNPDLPTGHDKVFKELMPLRAGGLPAEEIKGEEMPIRPKMPLQIPEEMPPGPLEEDLRGSIVVPAVKNKGKKQPVQEYDEGSPKEENKVKAGTMGTAEPLSVQAKKIAEPYYTLIELSLLEKLFSKNWVFRESGLNDISQELADKNFVKITMDEDEKIMVNLMGLMAHLINDKVAQVSLRAMGVADELLKFYPYEVKTFKSLYTSNIDSCMVSLMEKIGDSNPKVRGKAEETCINLATEGRIPLTTFIVHCARTVKKGPVSTRHLQGKLGLLTTLFQQFGEDAKPLTSQPVIDFALNGAKNSNGDVRNTAYTLLVEIYKRIGGKINGYLENLRPAQKEVLQAEFDKVEGGNEAPSYEPVEPKPKVTTNIQRPAASKAKPAAKAKAVRAEKNEEEEYPSSPQSHPDKLCEYCGKFDPSFTQDSLDMHMFNDCPMLYLCSACGNIIEIININNHLLNECPGRKDYAKCPVCHEAVLKSELDMHVEEGACKTANTQAIRCPLCHMDVSPATIEMWRDHILVKQCPNNERRPI